MYKSVFDVVTEPVPLPTFTDASNSFFEWNRKNTDKLLFPYYKHVKSWRKSTFFFLKRALVPIPEDDYLDICVASPEFQMEFTIVKHMYDQPFRLRVFHDPADVLSRSIVFLRTYNGNRDVLDEMNGWSKEYCFYLHPSLTVEKVFREINAAYCMSCRRKFCLEIGPCCPASVSAQ